jgi:hypothetical protein
MKKVFLILLLLTSCAHQVPEQKAGVTRKQPEVAPIPSATWEPIFFKTINKRASEARLPDLRSSVLTGKDLELRMWSGFGLTELRGYLVKRVDGQWSGQLLLSSNRKRPSANQFAEIAPKSGWEVFWARITQEGLLTLPDSSQLPEGTIDPDGIGYVIEICNAEGYRTYMYQDPRYKQSPEFQHMSRIVDIFFEEFGV